MNDSLGVTPEALRAAGENLGIEGRSIQTALDDLDRDVQALQQNWDGAARAAYADAQRAWTTEVAAMRALLSRIAVMTEGIAEGYAQTDGAAAARFSHR